MNDFSDTTISRRDLLIAGAISASAAAVPSIVAAQDARKSVV